MADCLLQKCSVPLEVLLPEPTFIIRGVREKKLYENGLRTEKTAGFTYSCINTRNFCYIPITVKETTPSFSEAEIENSLENGEQIIVEFVNARVKAYVDIQNKKLAESITADQILPVKVDV